MTTEKLRRGCVQCGIAVLIPLTLVAVYAIISPYIARSAPQQAAITQLNPPSAIAGGPEFVLTITAADFDTNTVRVLWNGAQLADSGAVNTTTVTATVPAANIAVAGYVPVVLTDTVNGTTNPLTFTILNPLPAISAVDPVSVTAGDAFTLTITGTGFVASSSVSLASTSLSVTGQTSVTLTAVAASGVFTRSGQYSLAVTSPAPGGGSAAANFVVASGPLAMIAIEPAAVTIPISASQVFTAGGADIFGNAIAPLTVTWVLSPAVNGSVVSTSPLTMLIQAGTTPGVFPAGVQAGALGITATADLTVTAGPLAFIHLTPAGATLAPSGTQLFTATGTDSAGNPVTPLNITWNVSPSIAGSVITTGPLTAVVGYGTTAGFFAGAVSASSAGITGTANLKVTAGPLSRISLTPPAATLAVSTTQSFTATGYDSYNNEITPLAVTWSVTPASAGSISPAGALTATFQAGASPGVYPGAVRASAGGVSGTADVTITASSLAAIRLTPGAVTLAISATQVFTASGEDAYGNAVTPLSVAWSFAPSAGQIIASGPYTVEFRAGTVLGSYTGAIWAVSNGITGTADVTVTPGALATISISPSTETLAVNTTATFTATGYDSHGNMITPLSVTWTVSPGIAGSVLAYGPLTATFQAGIVANSYPGALRATAQGITGNADVTVAPGVLASISIQPPSALLTVNATAPFTATGYDSYNNQISPLSVTWSVSPGIAGSVTISGPLTATFQAGTTAAPYLNALRATAFGITGYADITVVPGALNSISIAPPARTLTVTASGAFTATGYDSYNNQISPLTVAWTVSPGIAGSVTISGPLTATFQAGTTAATYLNALRATAFGITGYADITVAPGALATISIAPPSRTLSVTASGAFTATGYDSYNNQISPLSVTWSVSPSIAGSVTISGPLTATFLAGTTAGAYPKALRASVAGISGTANITVNPGSLFTITLAPGAASIVVSATAPFTATGLDSYGNTITPLTVTWSIAPAAAGKVVSSRALTLLLRAGIVAGLYPDAVRASAFGVTGTADVTVIPGALASLALSPNAVALPVDTSQTFTALGRDIYGNLILTLTPNWSASSAAGSIASSLGLTAEFHSGTLPGSYPAAIRAGSAGITASADITVTPGPLYRISLNPPLVSLPISTSQLFTATAYDVFSNVVPGLTMSWSTSPGAGVISSSGPLTAAFMSGVTPGTYFDAVQATYNGIAGGADVIVREGAVAQVVITPSVASLPVNATQLFTATVLDAANNPLALPVTWLPPTGGTIQSSGAFTMLLRAGTLAQYFSKGVQAAQGIVIGTADLNVTPGPLAGIVLTPSAASLPVSTTRLFTAVGSDAYGNNISSFSVTWSVSPTIAGGVQSSAGVTAVFRAGTLVGYYPGAIRARNGSISDTSDITVTPGALARLTLAPPGLTLPVNATGVFTASGYDAYNNTVPGIGITWTVSPGQAGAIASSASLTSVFQAGTSAGVYPNAVQAHSGAVVASSNVTITAGSLATITLTPAVTTTAINATLGYTATGTDVYGNPIPALSVAWSADSAAGIILLSNPTTAIFRAGTAAGPHAGAVRATQNNVTGTADVTILPDPPAQLTAHANPSLLRTDGISSSVITVNAFDQYGNPVSAGASVTLAVACSGTCSIAPASGTIGTGGAFSATLTGTLRSATQTLNSTLHVTATLSPAIGPGGTITSAVAVTGIFKPAKVYLPVLLLRYPLNNHTSCTALTLSPPATVTQPADQNNLYRFTAATSAYQFNVANYPASGVMIVYSILADNCAVSSTLSLSAPISYTYLIAGQPLVQWSPGNVFAPGQDYLVFVYNSTGNSAAEYTLSIIPQAALNLARSATPLAATGALQSKPATLDTNRSQSALSTDTQDVSARAANSP